MDDTNIITVWWPPKNILEKEMKDWEGIRNVVIRRDEKKCSNCNAKEGLVVHHIDHSGNAKERHINSNNNLLNLVTLCSLCHGKRHQQEKEYKDNS